MFFTQRLLQEMLIVSTLEHVTFNPGNVEMNKKFHCVKLQFGDKSLFWCRFPREFQEVCLRIASVYNVHRTQKGRTVTFSSLMQSLETQVTLPYKNNILFFDGKESEFDAKKLRKAQKGLDSVGQSLERLGVD